MIFLQHKKYRSKKNTVHGREKLLNVKKLKFTEYKRKYKMPHVIFLCIENLSIVMLLSHKTKKNLGFCNIFACPNKNNSLISK